MPSRPVPDRLALPLRDALRGVRSAKELSEMLLRPATELLPGPVQSLLRQTVHQAERVGKYALSAPIPGPHQMARAVAALAGRMPAPEGRDALLAALTFGLEQALADDATPALMMSETVAALAIDTALPAGQGDAAERAAGLLDHLHRAHVVGPVPGTGLAHDPASERRAELAFFAVCLWLICERPDAEAGAEDRILALCIGLCAAVAPDIEAVLDARASPADLLRDLAGMV
ncbi:MAG: hypothetical protein AAGD12_17910 [Pseudomonadota bacterium]